MQLFSMTEGQYVAIAIVLTLFVWAFVLGAHFHRFRPRRYLHRPRRDFTDVGEQMKAVIGGSFQKQRLMSPSEFQIYHAIERDFADRNSGLRVFAQTVLGEILTSPDEAAYRSINSKRIDILIVDRSGFPLIAIEYQGRGHFRGTAAARDAVKKEALRKAGVHYLEVFPNDPKERVLELVHEQLGWKPSANKEAVRNELRVVG